MFNIIKIQSKYFLRNSPAVPFFYKKFYRIMRPISNLFHFLSIGRFASGVMHDIANPLTTLLLSLNLKNKPLEEIEKSSKEITDILRVVQNQLRNTNIKEDFSVSDLIQDCFILMRHKSISSNVRLIKVLHEDFILNGNKMSLMRVLINLISNAIESYEDICCDKKDVTVSIFKDEDYLCISVKDFGCGLSEKQKKKVFRSFYTSKSTGTGIGLYVSQKNIKLKYSGKIEIESKESFGSTFTIKIPQKSPFISTSKNELSLS